MNLHCHLVPFMHAFRCPTSAGYIFVRLVAQHGSVVLRVIGEVINPVTIGTP